MITLRNLEQMVEGAEQDAYELSLGATPKQCADMEDRAYDVWGLVLGYFGLTYSNPGEPEAYNDQFKVPLAGSNCDVYTYEEDELIIEGDELNNDLYWARLRLQQARGLIDDGWQSVGEDFDEVKFAFVGGEFSRAELPGYCTFATDEQMEAIAREADGLMVGNQVSVVQRAAYNVIGRELEEQYPELA